MNTPKTILEPIAGYLLDTLAKVKQSPFVPHSYTKLQNINVARKISKATTVIEIGSYKGVTTRRFSYLFDEVKSVEIDEALHLQAKEHCNGRTNVEMILGDGSVVLKELAPVVSNALLFLDGHFSGGDTGMGEEEEPVLKELDIISEYLHNFSAFVIDDFREFGTQKGWPSKYEVLEKLESIFPSETWKIHVQYDQVLVIRQ